MPAKTRIQNFKDMNTKRGKKSLPPIPEPLTPHLSKPPIRAEIENILEDTTVTPSMTKAQRNAARMAAVKEYMQTNWTGNIPFDEKVTIDLTSYVGWEK